jgi:hypothetical protein
MNSVGSALPILRQLGSHGNTGNMIRSGDFSMLKVWLGLELRGLFQASVELVRSFMTLPTLTLSLTHNLRLRTWSNPISYRQMFSGSPWSQEYHILPMSNDWHDTY